MKTQWNLLIAITLATICTTLSWSHSAMAQTGPIKLVVAFAPGGGSDTIARVVAQALSKKLNRPVVVDNRPGAAGSIGSQAVAMASPDGSTLLLGSNGPIAINPSLYKKLPYSPSRDFTAVAGVATMPFLLVANPKVSANSLRDLIVLAKKEPGQINFASPGVGTTNHLVGELLKGLTGADMTHVPYKGAALAMNAVVSGEVQLMSGDISTLMPMVQAGRVKALAVTSLQRTKGAPGVPTVAESGFDGFDVNGWFGVFAPAQTPKDVVERLSAAIAEVVREPEVQHRIEILGGTSFVGSRADFDKMIKEETAKWKKVMSDSKITLEAVQ